MKNRRSFLAVAVTSGIGFALAARASDAESPPPTKPATSALASPKPRRPKSSPSHEKPPSATALALAASMRAFDAHLSSAQISEIARGITDNQTANATLNPQSARLRNGDEPVTHFSVGLWPNA